MTTTPPPQESNRAAYRTEEGKLPEFIHTWHVDQELRSYRETGKIVHADHNTVKYRVQRVKEMLKSGELVYVEGEIREAS